METTGLRILPYSVYFRRRRQIDSELVGCWGSSPSDGMMHDAVGGMVARDKSAAATGSPRTSTPLRFSASIPIDLVSSHALPPWTWSTSESQRTNCRLHFRRITPLKARPP